METKRTTYTLDELNHEVLEGHIFEVSVSGADQSIRLICSQPTPLRGGICGAHLRDVWLVTVNGERMFEVACGVCGYHSHPDDFTSYRRLGREQVIDGEDNE